MAGGVELHLFIRQRGRAMWRRSCSSRL